jgi:hypothetical protein
VWIGGVPVRDGDRVRFGSGSHDVLARVALSANGGAPLLLRFLPSDDDEDDVRRWRASVRRSRGILERVVRYKAGSELAAKARACLAASE